MYKSFQWGTLVHCHHCSFIVISHTSKPITQLQIFYVHVTVHRNKFLFNKTNNRRTNFPNLFLSRNSTCFGQFLCPSSGVFLSTFGSGTWHAGLMTAFKHDHPDHAWKLSSHPCDTYQCRMYSGTPDDGQWNCRKHVEFLDTNKFGKLVRLLVLLKRNYRYI